MTYRMGAASRANWSSALQALLQPQGRATSKSEQDLPRKLKIEFLRILTDVKEGHLWSLPILALPDIQRVHELAAQDALAVIKECSQGSEFSR